MYQKALLIPDKYLFLHPNTQMYQIISGIFPNVVNNPDGGIDHLVLRYVTGCPSTEAQLSDELTVHSSLRVRNQKDTAEKRWLRRMCNRRLSGRLCFYVSLGWRCIPYLELKPKAPISSNLSD